MSVSSPTTSGEQTLYAGLELSKNSWLLAIQLPDRDNPSLHPIKGGDAEGLIAKLDAARQRLAKASGQVPKLTIDAVGLHPTGAPIDLQAGRVHDPTVNAPQLEEARQPEAVVARLVAERQLRHLT